jgi:hypothetical protein
MIRLFVFSFFLIAYTQVLSQKKKKGDALPGLSPEKTIEYINIILAKETGGNIKCEYKDKQVWIIFFKNSVRYREDVFYPETIDFEKIHYSAEEKALIIRCYLELEGNLKKFRDGCIDRNFMDKGIRRAYGRVNIEMSDNADSVKKLKKAFEHLCKQVQDPEYQGVESLD